MKTMYLTGLVLLMVACSGGQTTGGEGGQTQAQLKKAAAEAKANGTATGDPCRVHGWYGDGECDKFCPDVDSVDCTPSGGGGVVHCAEFTETANGFCSRKQDDPCIAQDPDCGNVELPPGGPIVCPAIALVSDGVCTTDPSDPCLVYEDPDCVNIEQPYPSGGSGSTPLGGTGGSAAYPSGGAGGSGSTPPAGTGGSSPYPSAGAAGSDPGTPPVVCAQYIEQSDGVCNLAVTDPCFFHDPDCDF